MKKRDFKNSSSILPWFSLSSSFSGDIGLISALEKSPGEGNGNPLHCYSWVSNAGLAEAEAGIKIAGINISNLRYADDTTLMVESEEELKSLLMGVKEESEKASLKLSIQ